MKYRNISHSVDILKNLVSKQFGKVNYLRAYWWGVRIGKNVTFIGRCHLNRFPGSVIFIGNKCEFRSKPFSNQIGVNRPCMISSQTEVAIIEIGKNCGFSGTVIAAFKEIKIGNNVKCGANTLITDSDWHGDDARSGYDRPVRIEDNVWLGEGVRILKGVTVGENSVIGSGSIVRKSIPPNAVATGDPCTVVKMINKKKEKLVCQRMKE